MMRIWPRSGRSGRQGFTVLRRRLCAVRIPRASALVTGVAFVAAPVLAAARQTLAVKRIRFIVPFFAGGTIGTVIAAKATPDDHTPMVGSAGFVIGAAPHANNLPYDAFRDFTGVTQIGCSTSTLVVTPMLGVISLAAFIDVAKSRPGTILFSSDGANSRQTENAR